MKKKIDRAKGIIRQAVRRYKKITVACSFGKDSMTVVHLARQIDANIPIFSIMTIYKPEETFKYLIEMNKLLNLNVLVYMVADKAPSILKKASISTKLLPIDNYLKTSSQVKENTGKDIFRVNPDLCCQMLKVYPAKVALREYQAWITGLRNSEAAVRNNYHEIEKKGQIVKINPILDFTEDDVWQYLKINKIPVHPWYQYKFADERRYRSLGCAPCTRAVFNNQKERDGRWENTNKRGGECGIHTQFLSVEKNLWKKTE